MALDYEEVNAILGRNIFAFKKKQNTSMVIAINETFYCTADGIPFLLKQFGCVVSGIKSLRRLRIRRSLFLEKGLIFIRSLNGFVVIDYTSDVVHKYLLCQLEPDFLSNEITATALYKKNTPAMLCTVHRQGYDGFVQELIQGDRRPTWDDWHTRIKDIFAIMSSDFGSFRKMAVNKKVGKIQSYLENILATDLYFQDLTHDINVKLTFLLNHYACGSLFAYDQFCHGDLTPNNVIIRQNEYVLIDFANGGVHSFSYDLLIQNFYFPQSDTWTRFDKIDFFSNSNKSIFFGASAFFFELAADRENIVLKGEEIKFSLVAALAEIYAKNVLRYQSDSYLEGVGMINNVAAIAENIIQSIER